MNIKDILELNEGLYDPHTFKAVFMVGGPGSGKTFVASKLFKNTGLRVVNLDNIFEHLTDKVGIVGKGYEADLRKHSGLVAQRKMDTHIEGRMGLLIDSTGKKLARLKATNERLKSLGYDTMCIYVKTTLDTALDRSERRRRRVDPREAEKMHMEVKNNMSEIRNIFNNFIVVNNNSAEDLAQSISKYEGYIDKFLNTKPKHPVVDEWKKSQERTRNRT